MTEKKALFAAINIIDDVIEDCIIARQFDNDDPYIIEIIEVQQKLQEMLSKAR